MTQRLGSKKRPPADLRVRRFAGPDGKEYAAIWFSPARTGEGELSAAESEVATMLVAGWSNAAIAKARRVSPTTVANQARSIYAKLGISSRAELVALKDPL